MKAIVIGASGGIGSALCALLEQRGAAVTRLSRSSDPPIDLMSDDSIEAAAAAVAAAAPFDLILIASGILHGVGLAPEKSLRQLDGPALTQVFRVNAIGPALVARHFVPLLRPSGRAIFAALSARVGSIGDNRLGGWFAYRASKAALNQIIRTLAIELARSRPDTLAVALHPGTVDTPQRPVSARARRRATADPRGERGATARHARPPWPGRQRRLFRLARRADRAMTGLPPPPGALF